MFDDRMTQRVFYQSFFDELESLEKHAMLTKEALSFGGIKGALGAARDVGGRALGAVRGFGGQVASGAREIGQKGLGGVKRTFTEGALEAPMRAGVGQTMLSGAGKVLDTDAGKALATGAVGAGLAVPAAIGYAAGRGRGQPPQPQAPQQQTPQR